MPDKELEKEPEVVGEGIKEMKLQSGDTSDEEPLGTIRVRQVKLEASSRTGTDSPTKMETKATNPSPKKSASGSPSPNKIKGEHEQVVGGEVTVKMEPGQPPKLSRTSSHKIMARTAPLFDHFANKTEEATSSFQLMTECSYQAKYLGTTEHAMECDCSEEWDAKANTNNACGDDSDCINRATKMECFGDCGCGSDCQNQRFQRQQYATVAVIQTDKKGYGLRTDTDLQPNDFIFEYIGEVINETQFRRRMILYDEEGIKHFYFMSLSKGEFVDATKKGNLDKWVVGDKLRMGIFAERKIKAGEELVFNYNVDRYGADPQPCYCAEPNCTGFIGGKTQTERATKLSNTTIEALGIDDGDGWDLAVAKKPRKKKAGEDDEEYVNNVQPKSLDEDGVTKVMATLLQCKEKWIAVKLLDRIQRCDDERVINRVVKMHGYQILNSALSTWKEDFNVVLQILDILNHFPRLTKNKISDSKIEATVTILGTCGDERVESRAAHLLKEWSTLETAYRIPRMKRDPNSTTNVTNHYDRRENTRDDRRQRSRSSTKSRSRSRSLEAPKGPAAPTGPRNNVPQRNTSFFNGVRPPYRQPKYFPLPPGWFAATANGSTYYYSANGQTTWDRPEKPASQPPPPPRQNTNQALNDIINEITSKKKTSTPAEKTSSSATPVVAPDSKKNGSKDGKEKWRSLSEEKQKKVYENTLFPHVKYVVDKYKGKIPKELLKQHAKETSKKLVNSDFKKSRVDDPTIISKKHEKEVKAYVRQYFDKLYVKQKAYDKKKAEKKAKETADQTVDSPESKAGMPKVEDETEVKKEDSDADEVMNMSDDEDAKEEGKSLTPITPMDQITNGDGLKRKRDADEERSDGVTVEDEEGTPSKRPRSITPPAPPPPPPPPPAGGIPDDQSLMDDSGSYEDMNDVSYPTNRALNVNGNMHLANSSAEGYGRPPPPPPPLSTSNLFQHGYSGNQFDSPSAEGSSTPAGLDSSVSDEADQAVSTLGPERSQLMEVQHSR